MRNELRRVGHFSFLIFSDHWGQVEDHGDMIFKRIVYQSGPCPMQLVVPRAVSAAERAAMAMRMSASQKELLPVFAISYASFLTPNS